MQVIAALTIWGLFAAFLIFPLLGLPRLLRGTAAGLLVAEGVALMMWGFGDEDCRVRPCAPVSEIGYTAAKIDIPLLALGLLGLALLVGVRGRRRRRLQEPV